MKILKVERTKPDARRGSKTLIVVQYDLLRDGDATPEKDAELVKMIRTAISTVRAKKRNR